MLVLDASSTCDLLLGTSRAGTVAAALAGEDERLHAPDLLVTECVNVLRRQLLRNAITKADVTRLVDDLYDLDITLHGTDRAVAKRTVALLGSITAMDAAYVALCEALDATLVTSDLRLARMASAYCHVNAIG